MSDVAIDPSTELVAPAPDVAAAELEAAPAEAAVAPGAPTDAPAMPDIDHPIGPLRQAVLDALLDTKGRGLSAKSLRTSRQAPAAIPRSRPSRETLTPG
jgi:hypothetical protein